MYFYVIIMLLTIVTGICSAEENVSRVEIEQQLKIFLKPYSRPQGKRPSYTEMSAFIVIHEEKVKPTCDLLRTFGHDAKIAELLELLGAFDHCVRKGKSELETTKFELKMICDLGREFVREGRSVPKKLLASQQFLEKLVSRLESHIQ